VCVLGVDDPEFMKVLKQRTGDVSHRSRDNCNAISYGANSIADLRRLEALREKIIPNGAIWVVSRKGKAATLKDTDVIAAAKSAKVVDNKVVSFSATRTSLRLAIPVALRV